MAGFVISGDVSRLSRESKNGAHMLEVEPVAGKPVFRLKN
jgi:hypothetical protein